MIVFITFGAGGQNYYDAVERLTKQASTLNLFNKIIAYNDKDLINDTEFWSQHSNFIQNNSRGYGYWVWKSYIIKKTMDTLNNDDILLYLDCGCEININKKIIISEYFELVKKDYIIGTETFIEKKWTKMDLLLELDTLDDKYLNTPMRQAGAILFYLSDKTREFVNKWYELSSDYHNIDDTPSISKNLDCFIEHRHDQSIFSLLTKKYNLYSNSSLYNCIDIIQNRTGISRIQMDTYNGQAEQDKFILKILKEKQNGYFLEIGSNDPININNTYLLENKYNWKGIMIEYNSSYLPLYKVHRSNSIHVINDATMIDYKSLLDNNNMPVNFDYLQIDLEADNGSTIKTLQKLNEQIFDKYKFATITFEHDVYHTNTYNTRHISREIFNNRGYICVFEDIHNIEPKYVYEDWYVHPDLVNMDYIKELQEKNKKHYVFNTITQKSLNWQDIEY